MDNLPKILRISDKENLKILPFLFGQLVRNQQNLSIEIVKNCRLRLQNNPDLLAEWNRAVAEELLCLSIFNKSNPENLNLFAEFSPFQSANSDNCIQIKMLIEKDKAVAVIPLAANDEPTVAHIWLIETEDTYSKAKIQNWDSLPLYHKINEKIYKTYIVDNGKKITGKSFTLALELLKKAIAENNQKAKKTLALDWIITGNIENEKVKKVEIANKTDLKIDRNWLIPSDNNENVGFSNISEPIRQTPSLATAWNIITGDGSREGKREKWPENVKILHSFVSSAREPVVLAACLTQPEKIVLWVTDSEELSVNPYKDLFYLFKKILPNTKIEKKHISSRNIIAAEKELDDYFNKQTEQSLFNVTQGNRLMSFAAHTIAKKYHNILTLIYKDIDSLSFEFTKIKENFGV